MSEPTPVARARELLASVPAELSAETDLLKLISTLAEVRALIETALNEAMAEAALEGASIREVAGRAGLAPNSVPPRLARTEKLAPYAWDGTLTSSSIERARYDAESGRPASEAIPAAPRMAFQRRRSLKKPEPGA